MYVIVAVTGTGIPVITPVTTPVLLTVAMATELLLQVPPGTPLDSAVYDPWQTDGFPVMGKIANDEKVHSTASRERYRCFIKCVRC